MIDNTWRAQLDRDGTIPRARRTKTAPRKKRIHISDEQIRKRLEAFDGPCNPSQAQLDAERALIEGRSRRRPKKVRTAGQPDHLIYGPGE